MKVTIHAHITDIFDHVNIVTSDEKIQMRRELEAVIDNTYPCSSLDRKQFFQLIKLYKESLKASNVHRDFYKALDQLKAAVLKTPGKFKIEMIDFFNYS